jgi:hypothetical protein
LTITIKATTRTREILIDVPKHLLKHRAGLEFALYDIGSEVVQETQRLIINGPKTGRIYSFRGGRHQASAPGEPPANKTGKLGKSGDYIVRNWQEMTVGQKAEYADFLAKGTKKIKPRPSMIRAINSQAQNTVNAILENVRRMINS